MPRSSAVTGTETWLVVAPDGDRRQRLLQALTHAPGAAGQATLRAIDCAELVQALRDAAPHQIIAWAADDESAAALAGALACLQADAADAAQPPIAPLTVLLGPTPTGPGAGTDWARLGASALWPADGVAGLGAVLAFARQAHAQRARAHAEQQAALAQLTERKWVDRAKGLLMRGGSLSEDEAFRMLRSAAMQANLRLGELSRGVVANAGLAEAVNRAGQLRMLSQRFVKALALCAAGVPPADGAALRDATSARIDENLAFLGTLSVNDDAGRALAQVGLAWQALRQGAAAPAPDLAQAHAVAEQLLQGAETLTAALQADGGGRGVQVVNLCGRQRMLSQRLAKEALLAAVLPAAQAADCAERAGACAMAFEQAHAELTRAPLSTPAIREALAQVRALWVRLARTALVPSAEAPGDKSRPLALSRSSEELLQALEHLTERFESSLQLLLA